MKEEWVEERDLLCLHLFCVKNTLKY